MSAEERCMNMNHGRMNVPIRFCTDCGKKINASINVTCDEIKHAARRKERNNFCSDCGKKLR